jgi:S1-C subfamily serine protease
MSKLTDAIGYEFALPSKKLRGWIALIATAVLLLNAGCSSYRQNEATRTKSFKPHTNQRIGSVDAGTFLQSRVTLLFASDQHPVQEHIDGITKIPAGSSFGCAVAIDRRGYFLTASHCLAHETSYLLFYSEGSAHAMRARIVWHGDRRKGQPDLAILHVPLALSHTFDWADEIRKNEPAIAVGLSWTNEDLQGFALLGGKILDYEEIKSPESDMKVANDLPLQSGDSGGPLVDTEGRLIGINVQGTPPIVHVILPKSVFPMITERPNREWVRKTIEEDVARRNEAKR